MAAVSGRLAAYNTTLWYSSTQITTKNETNIEAITNTATNQVDYVTSMGDLSASRNIIDVPNYGNATIDKIPGQIDPGTFDFTVAFDASDTNHVAFRDDPATAVHSFILRYRETDTNTTYACFDGYIADATMVQAADGVWSMNCSIARTGAVTWVNNS